MTAFLQGGCRIRPTKSTTYASGNIAVADFGLRPFRQPSREPLDMAGCSFGYVPPLVGYDCSQKQGMYFDLLQICATLSPVSKVVWVRSITSDLGLVDSADALDRILPWLNPNAAN